MKTIITELYNYRLSILLIVVIFLQGCRKDWLDIKSDKRQAIPTTYKDMQAILDDVFSVNRDAAQCLEMNEVAADGHIIADDIFNGLAAFEIYLQNAYTWSSMIPFESIDNYFGDTFTKQFSLILNCNIVLDVKQGNNNREEFMHARAQALFHRAKTYYYLAQTLAPPYKAESADKDPGLQLRLTSNITKIYDRSSVKQTYDQIISDLKEAVENLPVVAAFITRPSRPAAYAMLAKVYLSMEDYTNALRYANEYLKLKNELLDYSTISGDASVIGLNTEVAFLEIIYGGSTLGDYYQITQELLDSYDANDLRKTVFFTPGPEGVIFKGYYSNDRTEIFMGLATDEIYLIRAECRARLGQVNEAMSDLNDLLRSRWAKNPDGSTTYVDQVASNETEALNKILLERRKQLILRGIRWTDLRRLNQDPRFAITLTRTVNGENYSLLPDSKRYTFPFPKDIIEPSGIKQNAGWE